MYKRSHCFHLVPVFATFCLALVLCSALAACASGQPSTASSTESSSSAEASSGAATSASNTSENLRDSSVPSSAEEVPTKPDRTDIEITKVWVDNGNKVG